MSSLANPQVGTTIPSDLTVKKQQIGQFITHLARQDNHLWQALTSLQSQTNGIVNQTTDWSSWTPDIKDSLLVPLPVTEVNAYFMTSGQVCYIELFIEQLTMSSTANSIQIGLPMDIGETTFKTFAAYMMVLEPPNNLPYPDLGTGLVFVQARRQLATIYVNPTFQNRTCMFIMGGAVGIIQ